MTTTAQQTWRVVLENGEVREVTATKLVGRWRAEHGDDGEEGDTARDAVVWRASAHNWPVVEIVAPGAQTADERLAEVTAERDKARADHADAERRADQWQNAAAIAANRRDSAREAGAHFRERAVTAEVSIAKLTADRDAAVAARDALAGAVREFGDAADALMLADAAYRGSNGDDHMAKVDARLAAGQRMGAVRVRLDAALAGTPVAMVRADVVRDLLDRERRANSALGAAQSARESLLLENGEREEAAMAAESAAADEFMAARAALDATLAAAGGGR